MDYLVDKTTESLYKLIYLSLIN